MSKPTKPTGRTLADWGAKHDKDVVIPNKIKAALALMAKEGPEHHLYEQEFLQLAKISTTDLSKYRDQFAAHIVVVTHENGKAYSSPKNVWFHDARIAKQLRGE